MTERCVGCGTDKIQKALFTSFYWECPICDNPNYKPEVKIELYDNDYIIKPPYEPDYGFDIHDPTMQKPNLSSCFYGFDGKPQAGAMTYSGPVGDVIPTPAGNYTLPTSGTYRVDFQVCQTKPKYRARFTRLSHTTVQAIDILESD